MRGSEGSRCSEGWRGGVLGRFCIGSVMISFSMGGVSYSAAIWDAMPEIFFARLSSWTYSIPCRSANRHEQHWN